MAEDQAAPATPSRSASTPPAGEEQRGVVVLPAAVPDPPSKRLRIVGCRGVGSRMPVVARTAAKVRAHAAGVEQHADLLVTTRISRAAARSVGFDPDGLEALPR